MEGEIPENSQANESAHIGDSSINLNRILLRIRRINELVARPPVVSVTDMTDTEPGRPTDMQSVQQHPSGLNPAAPAFVPRANRAPPRPRPPGAFRAPRQSTQSMARSISNTHSNSDAVIDYPVYHPCPHPQSSLSQLTKSEDVQYVYDVIECILKLEGSIHGALVQDFLTEGGLQQGILKFMSEESGRTSAPYIIMSTLPMYAHTFLLRDLYSSIVSRKMMSRSTVIDLVTPYGKDLSLVVYPQIEYHSQNTTNCELFLTSLDLLSLNRDGIYIHQNKPLHLKHRPTPFLYLFSQLSRKEYSWMEAEVASLRSTQVGDRLVHRHWSNLMEKGIYSDQRQWVFPSRRRLENHLRDEQYSCCICLDADKQEDDEEGNEGSDMQNDENTESKKRACEQGSSARHNQPNQPNQPTKQSQQSSVPPDFRLVDDPELFLELPCTHIFHILCFCKIEPCSSTGRIFCPLCRSDYDVLEL